MLRLGQGLIRLAERNRALVGLNQFIVVAIFIGNGRIARSHLPRRRRHGGTGGGHYRRSHRGRPDDCILELAKVGTHLALTPAVAATDGGNPDMETTRRTYSAAGGAVRSLSNTSSRGWCPDPNGAFRVLGAAARRRSIPRCHRQFLAVRGLLSY